MLFGEKKNPKDIEKSSPRLVIMNNDGTCNQMIKFFFKNWVVIILLSEPLIGKIVILVLVSCMILLT